MTIALKTGTWSQIRPWLKFGRLPQLWVLATLVLAYSVLEMAIANSLFLTKVGAGHLPHVFVLIGMGSLPSYLIFSQIVDRYSRPKLFQLALVGAIAIALGLRSLIGIDQPWVYYLLMVVIFFQWDFHNTILYPSLLTDYFTATEYKQNTPIIGIGQATGILLGGTLTNVLSRFIDTPNLLLVVPVLMGLSIGLLGWLEKTQEKPQSAQSDSKPDQAGLIESLRTFPTLAKKYPLTLFLAGSSFLLVILYLTTEFLWFSVYEQHFTSNELTQFLGLMRVVVSLVQMLVLYCFTRPLLQWVGVSRMNVVYPLTTLISLSSFVFQINLWTGIGLHLNGDGFFKSINTPVHQLNYNAIPQEFIGRIRTLSDGVFYSTGLMVVGVFLAVVHTHLTLTQISWIAIALGVLFFALRLPMGRFYGAGLEDMIRANTIDLSDLPEAAYLSAEKSVALIRDCLQAGDLESYYRGLNLAREMDCGLEILPDILSLQPQSDDQLRRKILHLFTNSDDDKLPQLLHETLKSDLVGHQAIALESLIAKHQTFSLEELRALLNSEATEIQFLGAIALTLQASETDLNQQAQTMLTHPFGDAAGQALLRILPYRSCPPLIELVLNGLHNSNQFAIASLQTLSNLEFSGSPQEWNRVVGFLSHIDSSLRAAAYEFLGVHFPQKALEIYPKGFTDEDVWVRDRVATLVAKHGDAGFAIAQTQLQQGNLTAQTTAIAALSRMKTKPAQECLLEYLAPEFELLKKTRQWQRQIPADQITWQPLLLTIQDFQARFTQKILNIVAQMGYEQTVDAVQNALAHGQGRDRANAIELLSSLKVRRFVRPLLPILENPKLTLTSEDSSKLLDENWLRTKGQKLLSEALASPDSWIKRGAYTTLTQMPPAIADPLKLRVEKDAVSADSMTPILLLKKVPIFQNLTLDELESIRRQLVTSQVFAKDVIYQEGSWGDYFYVIESGQVELRKTIGQQSYELKRIGVGEYFGEVCLFDDAPHWDAAIALEDCTLLKLEKQKFKALLMQRPRISLELCRYLSQRLREYDNFCDLKSQKT